MQMRERKFNIILCVMRASPFNGENNVALEDIILSVFVVLNKYFPRNGFSLYAACTYFVRVRTYFKTE